MTATRYVVDAPSRTPHRFGLFSVLDFQPGRGSQELAWDSLGCSALDIAQDPCLNADGAEHTKTGFECAGEGGSVGFSVIAYDTSSLGRPDRSATPGRARDRLILLEQAQVEATLSDVISTTATDVTPATTGPPATDSFADKVLGAVGAVEQALADAGGEGIVMLNRALLPFLGSYVTATGSMLRTKLGTPVAGFGGWSPADWEVLGVTAMVATRGDIAEGSGYALSINELSNYAERDYSLGWECDAVKAVPGDIA